jgi:outer membrane protein assembly factor BamE (lipoprotein component of BamABCDE complex)
MAKRTHGFIAKDVAKVRQGETKKETVMDVLGSPISFSLDPKAFHYVQHRVKVSSLRRPYLEKVYFCTVIFDDHDTVVRIDRSKEMPWESTENEKNQDISG